MARFAASLLLLVAFVFTVAHASTAEFILVPGAWQNASTFAGTVSGLADRGYTARGVNLPYQRPDATDAQRASVTYADYVAHMDQVMLTQSVKSILVCHSSAGLLCQITAGRHRSRISALVFLSAWVLYPGVSQGELIGPDFASFRAVAASRPDNSLPPGIDFVNNVLLPTDTQANRDLFISYMFPQPLPYIDTRYTLDDSRRFNDTKDSVPVYYVLPNQDTSGNYAAVAQNALGKGNYKLLSVPGGHQFFVFDPQTLVTTLDGVWLDITASHSAASIVAINAVVVLMSAIAIFMMM